MSHLPKFFNQEVVKVRPKQQERRPQVQNQQPDAPAHVDGDEPKKAHVRVKGEQIICQTYKVVDYLSKGAFSSVYKVADNRDGSMFALKEQSKPNCQFNLLPPCAKALYFDYHISQR
uniref:Protein kinase domain-containing protein n=1 Tax=Meloidogyne incognita TaxID=6306 RepID=A0A914NK31_MELIC